MVLDDDGCRVSVCYRAEAEAADLNELFDQRRFACVDSQRRMQARAKKATMVSIEPRLKM